MSENCHNVVYQYTQEAFGYCGVRFINPLNDESYQRLLTEGNKQTYIKIVAQDVSDEAAHLLCAVVPDICHLTSVVNELCYNEDTGVIHSEQLSFRVHHAFYAIEMAHRQLIETNLDTVFSEATSLLCGIISEALSNDSDDTDTDDVNLTAFTEPISPIDIKDHEIVTVDDNDHTERAQLLRFILSNEDFTYEDGSLCMPPEYFERKVRAEINRIKRAGSAK